jgi:predicted aspartyl protease
VRGIPLIIAPDPDEPEAAEVLIDGAVDGRPRRFLLDTGAARSQLVADPHTAGLATVRTELSHGAIAETTDELVRVPELAVGPLHARDIEVARVAPEQRAAHDLLGMDVLAGACCRFDLAHRRLRIEASPNPDATLSLVVGRRGHCYVELDWTGAHAQACFDTGAGLTIVDQAFIEEHPRLFEVAGSRAWVRYSGRLRLRAGLDRNRRGSFRGRAGYATTTLVSIRGVTTFGRYWPGCGIARQGSVVSSPRTGVGGAGGVCVRWLLCWLGVGESAAHALGVIRRE